MVPSHPHAVIAHRFAKRGDVEQVVLLPMLIVEDLVQRKVCLALDRVAVFVDVDVEVRGFRVGLPDVDEHVFEAPGH